MAAAAVPLQREVEAARAHRVDEGIDAGGVARHPGRRSHAGNRRQLDRFVDRAGTAFEELPVPATSEIDDVRARVGGAQRGQRRQREDEVADRVRAQDGDALDVFEAFGRGMRGRCQCLLVGCDAER